MAKTLPFIHIKAAKFPILPGEDEELVNPGTYGKALAQYLEARLKEKAYEVPFICCEDWGWWVEIKGHPFATGVCVYGTSDLAETHELCIAVAPAPRSRWSWRRFRPIDTTPHVTKLFADLTAVFTSDPEVEVLGFPEDYPLSEPLASEDGPEQ
jgi:hypothetical protein